MKSSNKFILLSIIISFYITNSFAQIKDIKEIYEQAGIIKIKDPLAEKYGSLQQNEYFIFSLIDINKFVRHVCPGVASGFIMTKLALDRLYKNEIPVRGNISVIAPAYNDIVKVILIILGIDYNEDKEESLIKVDKNLIKGKGFSIIFKRIDTNQTIKINFDKSMLVSNELKNKIQLLKNKVMNNIANENEKVEFREIIQMIVENLITNLPPGLINLEQL